VRDIQITEECLEYIESQGQRVIDKFFQLIEVIMELQVVHSHFVKKLQGTEFYELRIKAGNEYRVVLFTIDHENFNECTKAICLNGFLKKNTKDYKKALKEAESLLEEYLEE